MRRDILGSYIPGATALHRLGAGWKYLLILLLTLPPLIALNAWVTAAFLVVTVGCLLACGAGVAPLRFPLPMWGMVAVLAVFQVVVGRPDMAFVIAGNVVIAVYASRILTTTTPGPVLLDALVRGARPLAAVGLDPERFALAVSLMVRSIPYLVGSVTEVRDAMRARGQGRNLFAIVTPVIVRAVHYAHATGEALTARGLVEAAQEPGPDSIAP